MNVSVRMCRNPPYPGAYAYTYVHTQIGLRGETFQSGRGAPQRWWRAVVEGKRARLVSRPCNGERPCNFEGAARVRCGTWWWQGDKDKEKESDVIWLLLFFLAAQGGGLIICMLV